MKSYNTIFDNSANTQQRIRMLTRLTTLYDSSAINVQVMLFSQDEDLKLMQLVKDNPVLYDYNTPKYMDLNFRTVVWQKIGDKLKKPAAECKTRWIHIRDTYRRLLRYKRSRQKPYKYESSMSFMRQYYKDVTFKEEPCDDEMNYYYEYENDDEYYDETNKKRKKGKKRKEFVDVQEFEGSTLNSLSELDKSDTIDAFLLSIGATLKTFSPYHLNIAKTKIFSVVQEHDLQQIVQRQEESKMGSAQILIVDNFNNNK